MEKKDIAYQIGTFIEKASIKKAIGTSKVELPESEFAITGIYKVKVDEDSLTEFQNCWTFKAKAEINIIDNNIQIITQSDIVGNAVIEQADNSQPIVLSANITHIEIISNLLNESKR